ncbi:MAG: hypothetical protein CMO01_33200 [Thalassobius sp.]|nr:hypothetical protein [Thalassovita sp.]
MIQLKQKELKTISIHVFVWIFYVIYELSTIFIIDSNYFNFWETFFNFSLYAALFYTNALVIFPNFYKRGKYLLLVPSLLLTIAIFVSLRYILKIYIIPLFGYDLVYEFRTSNRFLAESIWRGGYFIMLSIGYWFATNMIKTEKERRKVEVAMLKSQINPHFLFNTLNFLYSKIHKVSEKTAEGILLLSDIMRYAFQEDIEGKVMLEEEVIHIKNYIAINQLRFENTLQIKFEIIGKTQFRMIIPLVLITLVENCFKHGNANDPEHPIIITLDVKDDYLIFSTFNKKRAIPAEKSTGVGLTNTLKRLDAIYGKNYSFNSKNEGEFYSTNLKIML